MTGDAASERLALLVHEVRSPTAALVAIAKTLGDGVDEVSRRELVRLAVGACRAIDRIVLDASLTSVRLEELDPGRLVRDIVTTAAVEGAPIRAQVEPDLPRVKGDPLRLRQALGNLVENALVHSGSDSEIVVGAKAGGPEEVELFVSDSGIGIPADDRERILEPGARLDARRPGSGLGLAVVKAIVDAHDGRLVVESGEGTGSTFTIALPAR